MNLLEAEKILRGEPRYTTIIMDIEGETWATLHGHLSHSLGDEIYIDNVEFRVLRSITQVSGLSYRTVVIVEPPE